MASVRADIIQLHPFRVRDGNVEHLVIRRSEADDLCPAIWQVVTGGTHDGETVATAAERELDEETSLSALQWIITDRVATFYFEPFDSVILSPIVACQVSRDASPVLSDEHSEHRWCNREDAMTILEFASHREGVEILEAILRANPSLQARD